MHKTKVQCSHVSNRECVLYGTFNQIFTAQTFLQDILHRRYSVLQESEGGNDENHQSDTTQSQQNCSATWDNDFIDNLDTENLNSFEVQPQFMKLINRVYVKKLRCIEETYGLKIVWIENSSHVQLRANRSSSNPLSYQEGCDAFIDLYQSVFPNMRREEVEIESTDDGIIETINYVETENNVVIEMAGNKLVVYAEKTEIPSSLQTLREKLGLQQGGGRKSRRSHQRTATPGALQHNKTIQDHQFSELPAQVFLSNGVRFSLYQGDITEERVDAIVNAANEWLQHGGGVAAAIVRKGGRQIEEESRRIILNRNRLPLNVGDAVYTKGGHLSCRYVIHTVGPRWNDYDRQRSISLLRRACMESLYLAAELKLSSIALPAISSGIFGMPKSICAQVMFKSMEEFSSSTDAELTTLRDVRIVIIDHQTISVFQEEFLKRYASQETSSATSLHRESRPSGTPSSEESSEEQSKNSGEDNDDVSAPNDRADSNMERRPSGTPSSKESSEEQSKNSREDNDNVKSPNDRADPKMESNKPSEQKPDGLNKMHPLKYTNIPNASKDYVPSENGKTNVETDVHGSNKENVLGRSSVAKRSNKSANDSDNVESSNEGFGSNVENNENRETIPVGIKEGLPPNNIESPDDGADPDMESNKPSEQKPDGLNKRHPSNNTNIPNASKHDLPSGNGKTNVETDVPGLNKEKGLGSSPSGKRSNKSDNVESSNEGDGANEENSKYREEIPAGIKEGLPSHHNNYPNTSKDNPLNGIEKSNLQAEGHDLSMEKGTKGSHLVKNSKSSNMASSARPSFGRGRGILAPNFHRRLQQEASKSESNESTPLAKGMKTTSAYVGKARGITFATSTSPPGLSVTEEGKQFARNLGKRVNGDQSTDPAESIKSEEELQGKVSRDEALKEENQELKDNYQNSDDDKLNGVPGSRFPHKVGVTDPEGEETKKDTTEKTRTDDEKELPTDENPNNITGPNQPENKPETGIHADHLSSNTTNDGASYPKELSPSNHPDKSPGSENVTPTASHESLNVRNMVEERRAAHSEAGKFVICL